MTMQYAMMISTIVPSSRIAAVSYTHLPGIILYGFDPSDEVRFGIFRPVMKLKTIVSMVKEMQPGQSASYGRRFTAEKPTRVATLCAGYADGYPRLLSCGKGIAVSYTHLDVYKRQAYTRPGQYDVHGILPTEGAGEELTPSVYEQFIARVMASANAAAEAAKRAASGEANAKQSASKAASSAQQTAASATLAAGYAEQAEAAADRAAAYAPSEGAVLSVNGKSCLLYTSHFRERPRPRYEPFRHRDRGGRRSLLHCLCRQSGMPEHRARLQRHH